MNRMLSALLTAFFPRRCAYCGRVIAREAIACEVCTEKRPLMDAPLCFYCGRSRQLCTCRQHRMAFDRCIAAMRYEGCAERAVLRLKHKNDADVVRTMAQEMVRALAAAGQTDFDVVTFVPMGKKEMRARGFNQSRLLALELAKMIGCPCRTLLQKVLTTRPQKELTRIERTGNLLGAFDIREEIDGMRILLVDDVMTTGATLHECAKMLAIGGASEITALVFAATVMKNEQK